MGFRYDTAGRWFKGNTHLHTQASDGGLTHQQAADLYAGAGYDFLFATDHFVESDLGQTSAPLLWLDGVELDGLDEMGRMFHVACLGKTTGITREMGFVAALAAARRQGAMLVLAHPFWTGNSFDDATRIGCHAVEIYNHVCHWLNGKGDSRPYWQAMLEQSPSTLALAVDDAHLRPEHPGWHGGWVMVNAAECSLPYCR